MKPIQSFPLLAGLCCFQMQLSAAPSIGVNFVENGDGGVQNGAADALGPVESAGAPGFAQINWNNLGRWGDNVVLNPTDGTSAVKVAWDVVAVYHSGASLTTGDGKLMSGYLDTAWGWGANTPITSIYGAGNNNKPVIMLEGLSSWLTSVNATTYSVIIYTDGDTANGSRTPEYWLRAVQGNSGSLVEGADLTPHIFAADMANFSGTYTQATSTALAGATAGNYVVFTGLSAAQFLIRSEENNYGGSPITGFQIVADPGVVVQQGSYWKGAASNSWTGANWTSDLAGTTPSVLGTSPIVSFAANGATNLATVLGADQSISKLNLTNGVGAVGIGGTHNLGIGSGGISVEAGTGPLTINTTGQVMLGADQTWINSSAGATTVNSQITGNYRLTTAGVSPTILTAANAHTGGTTVQFGTLNITNVAALGSGPLAVNGILNINGLSPTVAALTGSGSIKNSVAGTATFTVNNASASNYGGRLDDGAPDQKLSLVKTGAGELSLGGTSSFTGNIVVLDGTLKGTSGNFGGPPTTSSFGNLQVSNRTITVTSPGLLQLTSSNVFGNQNSVVSLLPKIIANSTTVSATSYNLIGDITLNASTLSHSAGAPWPDYQGYQFRGGIKVTGTVGASTISGNGGNHLSQNTIFDVEDVTAGVDLTISTELRNPSGDFGYYAGAAGGLTKTGAGTMVLTGSNVYTGNTVVNQGTLAISGQSLSDTGKLVVASGAKIEINDAIETVGALVLNGFSMTSGKSYGAVGSGAEIENDAFTGNGLIFVAPDPYNEWISSYFTPSDSKAARSADPDHDGLTNIQEFAFDSAPNDATASGKIHSSMETVSSQNALVLTIPVRNGATFSGTTPAVATLVFENIAYRIEGTNDLTAFDQPVSEVVPAASSGLPDLDGGWTYRSFRLNGNIGGATPRGPKGFLRAAVIDNP